MKGMIELCGLMATVEEIGPDNRGATALVLRARDKDIVTGLTIGTLLARDLRIGERVRVVLEVESGRAEPR
jgi:hypothetical protein